MVVKKYIKDFDQLISESHQPFIEVSKIKENDEMDVLDVLHTVLSEKIKIKKEDLHQKVKPRLSNGISICLKYNSEIVGAYLLNNKSINDFIDQIRQDKISDFRRDETRIDLNEKLSDKGLQGIALVVLNEYRGEGLGRILKEYTYKLGYDYIWGVQDKSLENIDFWTKTRKIFAESRNRYATYIKLK